MSDAVIILGLALTSTPLLFIWAVLVYAHGWASGTKGFGLLMLGTALGLALVVGGLVLIEYGATGSVDWKELGS